MSEPLTLESLARRVELLEAQLARRTNSEAQPGGANPSWTEVVGIMPDDEFSRAMMAEIAKLRQDERDAVAQEDAELEARDRATRGDAA